MPGRSPMSHGARDRLTRVGTYGDERIRREQDTGNGGCSGGPPDQMDGAGVLAGRGGAGRAAVRQADRRGEERRPVVAAVQGRVPAGAGAAVEGRVAQW